MGAKIVELPGIAEPTIDQILEKFLAGQRERLKPRTLKNYEHVIDLLRHHLNGYGYEGLSKAESALFDKHFNAQGEEHRDFCQVFGPDKIVENLGMFLNYFMVRKVIAGEDLMRAAGTVAKKLSKWLAEKEYISRESGREGMEEGAEASRELPNAERAARILFDAVDELGVNPAEFTEEDYLEFDHFTIARVEPGKLWFLTFEGGGDRSLGPVPVPERATRLLREGWEVSCALGRVRGDWRIVEVANVYPL